MWYGSQQKKQTYLMASGLRDSTKLVNNWKIGGLTQMITLFTFLKQKYRFINVTSCLFFCIVLYSWYIPRKIFQYVFFARWSDSVAVVTLEDCYNILHLYD